MRFLMHAVMSLCLYHGAYELLASRSCSCGVHQTRRSIREEAAARDEGRPADVQFASVGLDIEIDPVPLAL